MVSSHMQNEHFQNYTVAEGLSSNQVFSVYQDRSGGVWAVTQGGIDRLVGGRFCSASVGTKLGTVGYQSDLQRTRWATYTR